MQLIMDDCPLPKQNRILVYKEIQRNMWNKANGSEYKELLYWKQIFWQFYKFNEYKGKRAHGAHCFVVFCTNTVCLNFARVKTYSLAPAVFCATFKEAK